MEHAYVFFPSPDYGSRRTFDPRLRTWLGPGRHPIGGQVQLDNTGKVETLKLDRTSVPAGKVRFEVTNASMDDTHEMIVVKTPLTPDKFPTNKDGSKVDEKSFKGAKEVSDIKSGGTGTLDMISRQGTTCCSATSRITSRTGCTRS